MWWMVIHFDSLCSLCYRIYIVYAINFMWQNYFLSHETVLGSEKLNTEEGKIEIFYISHSKFIIIETE